MNPPGLHHPFHQLISFSPLLETPRIQTSQRPQTQASVRLSFHQAHSLSTVPPDSTAQTDRLAQNQYAKLWPSTAQPNSLLLPSSFSAHSNRFATFETSYLRHQIPLDDPPLHSATEDIYVSRPITRAFHPDPINAILSPPGADSPRPSSRASMVTLVDSVARTPGASSGSSDSNPPESDTSSEPVSVKREQLERSFKPPTPRKKNETPYGLPMKKMAALRTYCDGHAILPSQKSRKAWADLNGVAVGSVSKACSAIMRWKPDRHISREPWELPLETIADDELVVKEIKKEIKREIKKEFVETSKDAHIDVQEALNLFPKQALSVLASAQKDGAAAGPSTQRTIATPSEASPKPNLLSHLMPSTAPDPMKTPAYHANVSNFSAPSTFEESTDHEMMNYLLLTDFFEIVKGPYGIILADMVDWKNFEAKLAIRKCPFDPIFAWRALKRFYFFF